MEFWSQFEGQLLDGQFKLEKFIGLNGACAVFMSELAGQDRFIAVKIARSASREAERLICSWKHGKELQHPNLVRVYATGAADLDGLRTVYAATDFADATLDSVIQMRCLTEDEARDLVVSCAEVLHELHRKGFVHAHVRPHTIVAVDVATKLSSDYLHRSAERGKDALPLDEYDAPETLSRGYSPAGDVWSLGITLFQALKQRLPASSTDPELQSLPGPFPEIVQRCLDPNPASRPTPRQIISLVQNASSARSGNAVTAESAASSASPDRPESSAAPKAKAAATSTTPLASTVGASPPAVPAKPRPALTNSVLFKYAFSAIVTVVCLGWLARTSVQTNRPETNRPDNGGADRHVVSASNPPSAAPVQKETPAPAVPQEQERPSPFAPRDSVKAQRKPLPVINAVAGSPDRPRSIWRVVVYTYASAQNARKKADQINAKSPELKAQVLSVGGHPGHLVVVGGKMEREQAVNLRQRLVGQGFPPDVYAQNFPE